MISSAHARSGDLPELLRGLLVHLSDRHGEGIFYSALCFLRSAVAAEPAVQADVGPFALVMDHSCSSLACCENECQLCRNSNLKVCDSSFKKNYYTGESLCTACKEVPFVRIERVEFEDGSKPGAEELRGLPPFMLQVTPPSSCLSYLASASGSLPPSCSY